MCVCVIDYCHTGSKITHIMYERVSGGKNIGKMTKQQKEGHFLDNQHKFLCPWNRLSCIKDLVGSEMRTTFVLGMQSSMVQQASVQRAPSFLNKQNTTQRQPPTPLSGSGWVVGKLTQVDKNLLGHDVDDWEMYRPMKWVELFLCEMAHQISLCHPESAKFMALFRKDYPVMDIICNNVYCPIVAEMCLKVEEVVVKDMCTLGYIERKVQVDKEVWDGIQAKAEKFMRVRGVRRCTPSEGFGCMQFMLRECMQILESVPPGVLLTSSR